MHILTDAYLELKCKWPQVDAISDIPDGAIAELVSAADKLHVKRSSKSCAEGDTVLVTNKNVALVIENLVNVMVGFAKKRDEGAQSGYVHGELDQVITRHALLYGGWLWDGLQNENVGEVGNMISVGV
jgi:hypothetical protein